MKVLIIGSGGREHALAWGLSRSEGVTEVVVAPGNGGTEWPASDSACSCRNDTCDPADIASDFDLVVVGPEAPLVAGLADRITHVPVFGPSAGAARIEASKDYAKSVMAKRSVPTARHAVVTSVDELEQFGTPIVVKDDGLAAGKGVGVFFDPEEAKDFFRELKKTSHKIFVEEYLEGPELSVLAFCDGKEFALMPPARDFKRRFEGDKGPNTGGMGALSPVPNLPPKLLETISEEVFKPVLEELAHQGYPFVGALYAGLKLTPHGPKVLEFNCRFGDPETQVLIPQFSGNLAKFMLSCAEGRMDRSHLAWKEGHWVGVVLASDGYPGNYPKGLEISGLEESDTELLFHAGTARNSSKIVTNGGRVMTVVCEADSLEEARQGAYSSLQQVRFQGRSYRKDIASEQSL